MLLSAPFDLIRPVHLDNNEKTHFVAFVHPNIRDGCNVNQRSIQRESESTVGWSVPVDAGASLFCAVVRRGSRRR